MRDGQPVAISDGLTDRVRDQLTTSLLSQSSARIVLDRTDRCTPASVAHVLGIEIERDTGADYRVSLAIVDIEEGIWVNGTSLMAGRRRAASGARWGHRRRQHQSSRTSTTLRAL
ncbi:MAG: hypothetical protein U5O39_07355 [Gammaproteobacteria bacterium]|nr:hypothetical protein [Gammaproteobacteria bacterium]